MYVCVCACTKLNLRNSFGFYTGTFLTSNAAMTVSRARDRESIRENVRYHRPRSFLWVFILLCSFFIISQYLRKDNITISLYCHNELQNTEADEILSLYLQDWFLGFAILSGSLCFLSRFCTFFFMLFRLCCYLTCLLLVDLREARNFKTDP